MADLENMQQKAVDGNDCDTSALATTRPAAQELKRVTCHIPKLKKRFLRNRSVSNEDEKQLDFVENKSNLHKSELTELSEKSNNLQLSSNLSLVFVSPRNYHGQIPVFQRRSLNAIRMSPPITRSPSPSMGKKTVSLMDSKTSAKVKTITFDQDSKKKSKTVSSRSPSPSRKTATGTYKKSKTRALSPKPENKMVPVQKRSDINSKPTTNSPRQISPTKRKSKVMSSLKMDLVSKSNDGRKGKTLNGDVLKQSSQPSLCKKEKLVPPKEKISLDHLKNEVYSGDHRRLSFEKVHLCIEKSVENLSIGESKHSYMVRYSSEDIEKQEEISLSFLQNLSSKSITTYSTESEKKQLTGSKSAIRTLSGDELILTPSMKLDFDKGELGEDIEITKLLNDSGENYEESKNVGMFQDDANEYDSEMSTDGEFQGKEDHRRSISGLRVSQTQRKNASAMWKTREADLLNDVDYRQSVYHPAVSRRSRDENVSDFAKPKSKSIEDNFNFGGTRSNTERIIRSRSSTMKNVHTDQNFNERSAERSWSPTFDKTDSKPLYGEVVMDNAPLYGIKRIRSKKERVSAAFLRFTLKLIRLLAIFNIWPGDNCYMLTSQFLQTGR